MTISKKHSSRRALIVGSSSLAVLNVGSAMRPAASSALAGLHFNGAQHPYLNVKQFGAAGDGTTDDSAAIQAAINACDPNRGGVVFFPQGSYRIATGLTVAYQGTELCGEGLPGIGTGQTNGSTQIVSDAGITAITAALGAHAIRGYAFRRLQIRAQTGATTGNGILVRDAENCIFEEVTVSDYVGGVGLTIDGTASNAQYHNLVNFSAGDCLTGLKTVGAANGLRMYGGYFAGLGKSPRRGSVGISLMGGDTSRIFGTVIQGYAVGYSLSATGAGHEIHGIRTEFCNTCIHIGGAARHFKMVGGSCVNTLLVNGAKAGNVGIRIDTGAHNIILDPTIIAATDKAILDDSAGGVKYPSYTSTAFFQGGKSSI